MPQVYVSPELIFPPTNIIGIIKKIVRESPSKDAIYFAESKLRWTYKELNTYFSSFAFGIKEMGYKKGETIAIHTDNTHAAETLTSLLGSMMAGLNVCMVDSYKDSSNVLRNINPNAMLISPKLKVGSVTLLDEIKSTFPDMQNKAMSVGKYKLRHIIHPEFVTIKGMMKMSEMMCYTPPSLFPYKFEPLDEEKQIVRLYYTHDKIYSLKELTELGKVLNEKNAELLKSVVINSTLQNPAGILSVLPCLMNKGYACLTNTVDPIRLNSLLKSQMATTLISTGTNGYSNVKNIISIDNK